VSQNPKMLDDGTLKSLILKVRIRFELPDLPTYFVLSARSSSFHTHTVDPFCVCHTNTAWIYRCLP
jgi:hypothetical protein